MVMTVCRRLSIIGCLLWAVSSQAASHHATTPDSFDQSAYIDANSILMMVTNYGQYANDLANVFGYDYGTFYPFTSIESILNGTQINSPLYSAGLWIGGEVAGQTRVAIADFASEYWPGPLSGGTFIADADTVKAYRIYKLYADSLESNPNQDYVDWPRALGAPVDRSGKPLLRGSQTLWCLYNDANPARHTLIAGSTLPLGIETRQTVWASNRAGEERGIYIEYQLFNRGSDSVNNLYITPFFDPDLGGAEDDLTGCDTLSDLFFCYNATNSDAQYGAHPPALGVKMRYGPAVSSPGDSAYFFSNWRQGYRNLRMSSFISYHNGDDPQSGVESYNVMRGFRRNGTPLANGTKFSYPGDPVTGTGDLNTVPGNPHFAASFGPIDFLPGDSQSILIKLAIGQGSDRLTSITDLKTILNAPDSAITTVSDGSVPGLPRSFYLAQNYPNPFNPTTTIDYMLPTRSRVRLMIYNLLGRRIRVLVDKDRPAGQYRVTWDGLTDAGLVAASGVYLYRLEAGDYRESRKMILLK